MKSTLLIVTSQASLGVLIREGLDPTQFDAFFTSDFSDALHYVSRNNCPTVILDTELEDMELSVKDIGFALRQIKPDIQIVLVARAGQEVDTASLSPVATIAKPISLPDLPDLSRLLERLALPVSKGKPMDLPVHEVKTSERSADESSRLMWLEDVSKAAQQLTQLTLESSAQAAFITRQNELWAYAGQLSREAAKELTDSIQRYWNTEGESDLLRFVRLQATEAQHMFYVRKLSKNMTLGLVFDAETPFSTIRAQAGKLVKNLFECSDGELGQTPALANKPPAPAPNNERLDNGASQNFPPISGLPGNDPQPNPVKQTPKINLPWDQPSPKFPAQPRFAAETAGTQPGKPQTQTPPETGSQVSRERSPSIQRDVQKRPIPAMDETFASQASNPAADLRVGMAGEEIPDDVQVTRKQAEHFDPESGTETRAEGVAESMTDGAHRILLEPPSLQQVNLTYACLLIPRFEHHHLVGDAATRLNEWIPQLCVAFGWRLEYISVRPDYLQWIARVPLNTAAGYIINTIRKHTSERIFAEFPRFKADNPSGEFWAHGFIVQGGSQTHPQKQVREFITQTRIRQGLR